jgi:hypothetical protein
LNALAANLPGILAALAALVTAFGTLKRQNLTNAKVDTVTTIVNGHTTKLEARNEQLAQTIQATGNDVPPSPPGTPRPH